jgi:hypothetical protein
MTNKSLKTAVDVDSLRKVLARVVAHLRDPESMYAQHDDDVEAIAEAEAVLAGTVYTPAAQPRAALAQAREALRAILDCPNDAAWDKARKALAALDAWGGGAGK